MPQRATLPDEADKDDNVNYRQKDIEATLGACPCLRCVIAELAAFSAPACSRALMRWLVTSGLPHEVMRRRSAACSVVVLAFNDRFGAT